MADSTIPSDGLIQNPDLTDNLKPQRQSIKDLAQARNIIIRLEVGAKDRNLKNARIMAKYNAERPHTQQQLEDAGLAWKSNFTTKPLPMLIDKVAPRFVKTVDGLKYLTNSSLPETYPGAGPKSEAFRRELTSTVRARIEWKNFLGEVSQENALFGYTSVAWLDEFRWFPKHFRQDRFFIPALTPQIPNQSQICVFREEILPSQAFEMIEDKEAATAMGFNVPNMVVLINKAQPPNRRSPQASWERIYQDLIRESNVGSAFEDGANMVVMYHVLAQEVTGKVSHYILPQQDPKQAIALADGLFEREDQFDSMADAVAFFSFQQGNGTLHGSKGIGREIYGMAGMLDKARNEVVDRLNLAGKVIIQGDPKQLLRFKMSVVGNALLIDKGYEISDRKLDAAVEPFLELDQFLTGLLDQMAGATTPKMLEGERVTKAAVDLLAGREEETRDSIIGRFLGQFADMMTTIQKRLCDPNTVEPDAKKFQKKMLELMTREELDLLAGNPIAETVRDYTPSERQQIVLVAQEGRGNPLYNQKELERRKISAQLNEELADALLLPDEDPTITAEQTRLQQMELLILVGQASPVPISPRDNHFIHLNLLMPAMQSAAQETVNNPHGADVLHALLDHATAHFNAAQAAGADKKTLAQYEPTLQKLTASMAQINTLAAQEKQMAAASPGAPQSPAPLPSPPAPQ